MVVWQVGRVGSHWCSSPRRWLAGKHFLSSVFVMSSLMFFVLLQDVQRTFQSSFDLVKANFLWGLLLVEYAVKHYVLLSIIQAYVAPKVNRKDQLAFSPTNSRSEITKLDCGNMFTQSQALLCSPGQRIGELSMMGITWKECLPSPSLGLQAGCPRPPGTWRWLDGFQAGAPTPLGAHLHRQRVALPLNLPLEQKASTAWTHHPHCWMPLAFGLGSFSSH